jgi:outer membrane protein OmpA-like peptidoglycan-associated protein
MFRATIAALLGVSIFAGAQVASAQSAAVSEAEIKCFVSGCDEAGAADATDASADGEDDCMVSGICPVGETRGFHLSNSGAGKTAAAKPGAPRPTASRYAGTGSTAKVASSGKVGKIAKTTAMPTSRKSLDMRLSFELGSATLTPDARQQADIFARQIKDASGSREFVIEGHTDNVGNTAYNRQLSRERAQAVVTYLVGAGVPASKLRAVGYGYDHPRDGTTPADPSNRRVEIVRY